MALRRYEAKQKDGALSFEGEAKADEVAETVHKRLLEMAFAGTIAPKTEFRVRITEGDQQIGVWSFKAQPNRGEPGGPEMWAKLEKIAGKPLRPKRKKVEKKVATVLTAARPVAKKSTTAKKKAHKTKLAAVKGKSKSAVRGVKSAPKAKPVATKKRVAKAIAKPLKRAPARKRA